MSQLTLEVEIRNDNQSYTRSSFNNTVTVAPYNADYKRDEDSKHEAGRRLVFLAATLQGVLSANVLDLLGQFAQELSPSPVDPDDLPEDEDAEVEDNAVKVMRIVTFRLKGERDLLSEFTSSLELNTNKQLGRERMKDIVDAVTAPMIKRLVELLVLNEIIPALPDEIRTELEPDVQEAVDGAAAARQRRWQMQEKLEALRAAKAAKARAEELEVAIRAELDAE